MHRHETNHEEGRDPDDWLSERFVAFEEFRYSHNSANGRWIPLFDVQRCCQFTLRRPFPCGTLREGGMINLGSATSLYCDDFTAQFAELVNFEQFGGFLSEET